MSAMKSQEASSRFPYQVFLSFRGEDTRKGFTDHLYTSLDRVGFRTFRDDDGLERGEDIKSELEKAIRESRMSIIVFSKSYASSTWCLDELVMILKRKTYGHAVLPIFYDVDPSEVRKQNGSFKEAFAKHEKKLKSEKGKQKEELMDKVRTWRAALKNVADLAGMNLKTQADGHEARFIQKIINVVGDKISRATLDIDPHLVGIPSRVKSIQLWLEDESTNVGIVAICGMGGIGKTTIAKFLYNFNYSRFESSSFLENVRENSQGQEGLLRLQRRVLSDILKTRKVNLNSVAEGTSKIKDAIHRKRVFLVLDDVDKCDQLDVILGMRDWLFSGSKIIITTRRGRLLRANEFSKVHRVENLGDEESIELFSWHAFGKCCPDNDYNEVSKRVAGYCGGLPLALKVLGSSLSGQSLNVWKSQLDKLEAFPVGEIIEKLRISYDSLQDEHDKNLFLHLACFFVGSNKNYAITILDSCEFYTMVGIQNLVDRCLISIEHNNIVMHHLLQETAREIVNQDSTEPGERRILWDHKDAFNVLRHDTGTSRVEGLKLDMCLLKEDKYASTNLGCSRKRKGFSIFSSWLEATCPEISNQVVLEADAFRRMYKLKILQLNHVNICGPYKMLPEGLRWLCWREFPFKSIPSDFPLESLVVLDMLYSSLKIVWEGTRFLEFLKILNLSHSPNLAKSPDFSQMPNLESLLLKNCTSMVELHESIGCLEKLGLLNLNNCENLRKLPRSISVLKRLETLIISGCPNLKEFPTNMGNMDSLTIFKADGIAWNQSPSTSGEENAIMRSFIRPWLLKTRISPEISLGSLPRSLVELSLARCNLSDDAFSGDLSNLCSLKNIYLSGNPISSLPNFIGGLTGLEILHVRNCSRLRKMDGLPLLDGVFAGNNISLEEMTVRSCHGPKTVCHLDISDHLGKIIGIFKLEPIGNVAAEITKDLGLSNLPFTGNPLVTLSKLYYGEPQKLPLQGCHETHIFNTYLPGGKVLPWFIFKNQGSSVSFIVPTDLKSRVRGLSVCSVFERSCAPFTADDNMYSPAHIVICNKTKGLIWSYCPVVFGVGEAGEEMMWFSYWKFGNQLEGGDELKVVVFVGELAQVMEVGVRLLYEEEQEEMSSQSATEEVSQQIYPFGNTILGNVSEHQTSFKLYQLGRHGWDCKYCQSLYPQPWIFASPSEDFDEPEFWSSECLASRLLVPKPYYVSKDLGY